MNVSAFYFTAITLTPPSINASAGHTAEFVCTVTSRPHEIGWNVSGKYIQEPPNSPDNSIPGLYIVRSPISNGGGMPSINVTLNITVSKDEVTEENNVSVVCIAIYKDKKNNNTSSNDNYTKVVSSTSFLSIKGTLGSNFNCFF